MSQEQTDNKKVGASEYEKTPKGLSAVRVGSYRSIDAGNDRVCDLTTDWYLENMYEQTCSYCGFPSDGCDRIDNTKGHTKDNVLPCCKECNVARMDNFTSEEMQVIGKAIRQVKLSRVQ